MEFINKYKNILIGGVVLIAILGGYFYWNSGNVDVEDVSSLVYTTGPAVQEAFVGQAILSALNDLRRLKIDGSIFESAVFQSLVDHSVATSSEALGRPDPFAPLPGKLIK